MAFDGLTCTCTINLFVLFVLSFVCVRRVCFVVIQCNQRSHTFFFSRKSFYRRAKHLLLNQSYRPRHLSCRAPQLHRVNHPATKSGSKWTTQLTRKVCSDFFYFSFYWANCKLYVVACLSVFGLLVCTATGMSNLLDVKIFFFFFADLNFHFSIFPGIFNWYLFIIYLNKYFCILAIVSFDMSL